MYFDGIKNRGRKCSRIAGVLLCGALLCGLLTGCRSSRPQDGTYTARYQYPSSGYVEYLTVTFRDGRVKDAEFDAYLETDPDSKKSELSKEEYPMDPHPSEWMDELEDNIEKAGLKPDKIAGIAGATASSRHARELYDAILTAAKNGKTETIIVQNEEEGPDSGMTDAGSTSDSAGMDASMGENDSLDGSSGADSTDMNSENSADNGGVPGLEDGQNSGSLDENNSIGDGMMQDGASGGNASDNADSENTSGGNGTGTGEENSENTVGGTTGSSVAP